MDFHKTASFTFPNIATAQIEARITVASRKFVIKTNYDAYMNADTITLHL